jgi:hypothetical protein
MRGFVYRLGRRRAGSVFAALGVALTIALGSGSAALAKGAHAFGPPAPWVAVAPAHAPVSVRAPGNSGRTPAKPVHLAHAAGHKIA